MEDNLVKEFLLEILNDSNAPLIKELSVRWEDFKKDKASKLPAPLGWEVVERSKLIGIHKPEEEGDIYSVRRLSDGEVFKIGDNIKLQYNTVEIVSFGVVKDEMWAYGKNGFFISPIQSLSKVKEPVPLFTEAQVNEIKTIIKLVIKNGS